MQHSSVYPKPAIARCRGRGPDSGLLSVGRGPSSWHATLYSTTGVDRIRTFCSARSVRGVPGLRVSLPLRFSLILANELQRTRTQRTRGHSGVWLRGRASREVSMVRSNTQALFWRPQIFLPGYPSTEARQHSRRIQLSHSNPCQRTCI